ncbi:hypothetical protein RZN22_18410 [Bacillaceae bacterium S4-13-58]
MKKIILSFLLFCLLFSVIAPIASAKTLSYWYSDSNRIGNAPNRYIWSVNYDGFTASEFSTYLSHGRNQWSNAGISNWGADNKSSSGIWVFGGTRETLEVLEPGLVGFSALAVVYHEANGTHTYQGVTKYNRKVTKAEIYVPKQPLYYFWGAKSYRAAFTHELGHGLGWLGHSTSSNDVMHNSGYNNDVLTSNDKNHLTQNY